MNDYNTMDNVLSGIKVTRNAILVTKQFLENTGDVYHTIQALDILADILDGTGREFFDYIEYRKHDPSSSQAREKRKI